MAAEAGFLDVHIQSMEFASSLAASVRGEYQAYLIGWSGRVDIDGNTYAFLHGGQANNVSRYSDATVDKPLDQARGMTDVAQRATPVCRKCGRNCGGTCRSPICGTQQHRRDVGHADRIPCGAERNDPGAGFGDEPNRARCQCGDISGRGSRRSFKRCCWSACWAVSLQQLMHRATRRWCLPTKNAVIRQVLAQIRAELWLDRPLRVQCPTSWIDGVLHGNLGSSWRIREPTGKSARSLKGCR